MKTILFKLLTAWWRGRKRRRAVVDVPGVCGRRLSLAEAQAALGGQQENLALQSVLWLIVGRRAACIEAAQSDAHKNQDTRFQLGAKQALDDLLFDLLALLEKAKPDDEVRRIFEGAD